MPGTSLSPREANTLPVLPFSDGSQHSALDTDASVSAPAVIVNTSGTHPQIRLPSSFLSSFRRYLHEEAAVQWLHAPTENGGNRRLTLLLEMHPPPDPSSLIAMLKMVYNDVKRSAKSSRL